MTLLRSAGAYSALAGLMAAASVAAAAAEEPAWTPGRRVTASLPGELVPNEDFEGDGVYGRFDGDLFLELGIGAAVGGGARLGVEGRALYYHSLGVRLGYGEAIASDALLSRLFAVAIEIRPLFLPRWSQDLEFGSAFPDLLLDSLSLQVGWFFAGSARERDTHGVELGLGVAVPLFARARGLWLGVNATYRPVLDEAPFHALVSLSWSEPVLTPVVR